MNLDQLKRNIGWQVQLHPPAVRLDDRDNELLDSDDDWAVRQVQPTGIEIMNVATGQATTLGPDHLHHFTSNPGRSGPAPGYGFLTLTVQIFLRGDDILIKPTARPGERRTIDGTPLETHGARARLRDDRLRAVLADYQVRGTPKPIIDTFSDLTMAEKATLYRDVVVLKKGREPKSNPYE